MGPPQESTRDELRQTESLSEAVLQERHHQENGTLQAACVPVLSTILIDSFSRGDAQEVVCAVSIQDLFCWPLKRESNASLTKLRRDQRWSAKPSGNDGRFPLSVA